MSGFRKAVKEEAKLRMGIIGPSGSGKTWTAITIGCRLAKEAGGRLAVIDTERGSASKYADVFDFDVLELESFSPQKYVEAIAEAQRAGYPALVIDSLSHAWSGKDGALEMVDRIAKRSQSPNSFSAWRDVTPQHNSMVDAILSANMHIIATLRAKMEHVQEKDDRGKTVIRKIGLQPVQRDGLEYEFDVVGDMTIDNELIISKTRCSTLTGKSFIQPTEAVAEILIDWLHGATPTERPQPQQRTEPTQSRDSHQPPTRQGTPTQRIEEAGHSDSKTRSWEPTKVWPKLRKPLENGPQLSNDDVHKALNVASLDEWFDGGKTLEQAWSLCCDYAAELAGVQS